MFYLYVPHCNDYDPDVTPLCEVGYEMVACLPGEGGVRFQYEAPAGAEHSDSFDVFVTADNRIIGNGSRKSKNFIMIVNAWYSLATQDPRFDYLLTA